MAVASRLGENKIPLEKTRFVSQRRLVWENFKRHKIAVIAAILFVIMSVACYAAPIDCPLRI